MDADAPPSRAKAAVLAQRARLLMLASDDQAAIDLGREGLALAERFSLDGLRASALITIGTARTRRDPAGVEDMERGLEVALAAGDVLSQGLTIRRGGRSSQAHRYDWRYGAADAVVLIGSSPTPSRMV